ncbi:MAG: IclR family transcriptional regulator [Proteobacteria bacterium]|nr:IclR family transcriptional regulator [Pseudomonadota bacterium]
MSSRSVASAAKQEAPPRAPSRVLQMLSLLAESAGGMSLAEISEAAGVPKSSALNILRALMQTGHVGYSGDQYVLGDQTYRLAASVISTRQFPAFARPLMLQLADEAGESVIMGVPAEDDLSVRYIDIVESSQSIRFSALVGSLRPLYLSAGGWVLLAGRPDKAIAKYLRTADLRQTNPSTIIDPDALLAALHKVRQAGFALTVSQSATDVSGIAAPIFGSGERPVAALMIAAPHSRIRDRTDRISVMVQATAQRISRLLAST